MFPGESAEYRAARDRLLEQKIEPLWNLFDLTPDGRSSNWDEQLRYP